MTPRAILAAFLASCIISAIMVYLTAKKWEPSNGGPFCQYPTPQHIDYPMCEFKLRLTYIVNNG